VTQQAIPDARAGGRPLKPGCQQREHSERSEESRPLGKPGQALRRSADEIPRRSAPRNDILAKATNLHACSTDNQRAPSGTPTFAHAVFSLFSVVEPVSVLEPPAFRLTAGFSGLKFSLTWAEDGLSRLSVSQLRQCRRHAPAASLTACGLPTRISVKGFGSRRRASGVRADGPCPSSIGVVCRKNAGDSL